LQQGNRVFDFRSFGQEPVTRMGQGENILRAAWTDSFTASQNCALRFSTSFFIAAGVSEGGRE
jgi:hypothetical protein